MNTNNGFTEVEIVLLLMWQVSSEQKSPFALRISEYS